MRSEVVHARRNRIPDFLFLQDRQERIRHSCADERINRLETSLARCRINRHENGGRCDHPDECTKADDSLRRDERRERGPQHNRCGNDYGGVAPSQLRPLDANAPNPHDRDHCDEKNRFRSRRELFRQSKTVFGRRQDEKGCEEKAGCRNPSDDNVERRDAFIFVRGNCHLDVRRLRRNEQFDRRLAGGA